MDIGIIVYSYTNNTLSIAKTLCEKLQTEGHVCAIEAIKASDETPEAKSFELTNIPDPLQHDVLVLASPVRAFQVAPIMKRYLEQCPSLKDKPILVFLTHHFPFHWMGGNTALKGKLKLIQAKEGKVLEADIIDWSNKKRSQQIDALIERFTLAIKHLKVIL